MKSKVAILCCVFNIVFICPISTANQARDFFLLMYIILLIYMYYEYKTSLLKQINSFHHSNYFERRDNSISIVSYRIQSSK